MESWGLAVYREIVPPERLIYVDAFSDSDGTISADLPQMLITVTFEEIDGQTLLTTVTMFDSAEALQTVIDMGMEQGIARRGIGSMRTCRRCATTSCGLKGMRRL